MSAPAEEPKGPKVESKPEPRAAKGPGLGATLRTGGCLIAILVLMVILAGVALLYRPPKPPERTAGPESADAAGDVAPELPAIHALALSPDATLIAHGGEEKSGSRNVISFRRIDAAERKFLDREVPLRVIEAHADAIRALRFRPGTKEILSASLDGTVGRWNFETGEALGTLEPPWKPDDVRGLLSLEVSADGRLVAAAGWTGDIFVWDLAQPSVPPAVLAATRPPWPKDPKEILPAGHLEDVRSLRFLQADPPMLLSGGAEGLVALWNVTERRATRIVAMEGKTPNVRDLLMRQLGAARDRDFLITALLPVPERQGFLAADFRGCVYQLTTEGSCRDWWLGTEIANGATTCVRPILDKRDFCVPFDRPLDAANEAFLGLAPYTDLAQGWVGIAWNERLRVFRAADQKPWRVFEGAVRRREWMCAYDAAPAAKFLVAAGQAGHLRLYGYFGPATSPDIRLADEL